MTSCSVPNSVNRHGRGSLQQFGVPRTYMILTLKERNGVSGFRVSVVTQP